MANQVEELQSKLDAQICYAGQLLSEIDGYRKKIDNLEAAPGGRHGSPPHPPDTIDGALTIAVWAHKGVRDKAGQPYILHPLAVQTMVTLETEKILAILHDVIEDTSVTLSDMARWDWHPWLIDQLDALTHRPNEPRDDYYDRILAASVQARRVKLADIAHNMSPERLQWLDAETRARLGRTIYAVMNEEFPEDDPFIGIMETATIAENVCREHNASLSE